MRKTNFWMCWSNRVSAMWNLWFPSPNHARVIHEKREILDALEQDGLDPAESLAFLECLGEYKGALHTIDLYDREPSKRTNPEVDATHALEAKTTEILIKNLKKYLQEQGKNVPHFGIENNGAIESVIGAVKQTFDGHDLYPDIESKAANLLYLLVKNHYFIDGNKRIAAFLFIWFLDVNGKLYIAPDEPVISYVLLYKLTIFIAESDPKDKALIVALVAKVIALFLRESPVDD